MKSKCETCRYNTVKTKDITIRPSASACTWRTAHTYSCKANCYGEKTYLPMKGRCDSYRPKNTR